MHYGHCVYGATFLGRPNFALNAAGAPGFMTAGLQLFQWAVINLGSPETKDPTLNCKHESLSLFMIWKGPSKAGPSGVDFPFFKKTWVAFSADVGQ